MIESKRIWKEINNIPRQNTCVGYMSGAHNCTF